MHKEIIVTIDIGSSKIVAAAGKKDEKGAIHILALKTEATKTSVCRGRVYNLREVSNIIRKLLNQLNNELGYEIIKVYVGVGGQSLINGTYSTTVGAEHIIVNERLLNSLREECKASQPDLLEVLDIVSSEYFIDGKNEKNPIGVLSREKIDAQFSFIQGSSSIKMNLNRCISVENDIDIAGYFIAPIATATATLTEQEKKSGCALIEFGAGVTYLSIYKDNLLKYLITIPIGGNAITKDICDLNISEDEAEKLKLKYGNALIDDNKEEGHPTKVKFNGQEINLELFNEIVVARIDEIIANVNNQLDISGFSNALESGIIITGGGAALKNLVESIKQKINPKVRLASVKEDVIDKDSLEKYNQTPGIEQTIGLLLFGTKDCVKFKEIETTPLVQEQPTVQTPPTAQATPTVTVQEQPSAQATPTDMFGFPIKPGKTGKRKEAAPVVKTSSNLVQKLKDGIEIMVKSADKASQVTFSDKSDLINKVDNDTNEQ